MLLHGSMKEFMELIRWKNLLIVSLTMVLMRYAVIEPLIGEMKVILLNGTSEAVPLTLQFPWYDFVILVAATVFITAGGYVINDYFDIKTDLINRGQVIVGTKISRHRAMLWHSIFNVAGVIAGFYISWRAGYFWMGILFLLVSGLLYFYSVSYKRQFLIGNIIVAILVALVPMLVIFYEWPALYRYYSINAQNIPDLKPLFYWIGAFSLFAFITTLAREIIKDIEDFEGDKAYGRNTVPVIIGILGSRLVAIALLLITLAMLYLVWFLFVTDNITLIYISAAVALPVLYTIYLLTFSRSRKQIHRASNIMKIIMLTGILYSLVVKAMIVWKLL
jgi:4-hydroxybenzoate polyprenyltransferase